MLNRLYTEWATWVIAALVGLFALFFGGGCVPVDVIDRIVVTVPAEDGDAWDRLIDAVSDIVREELDDIG